MENLQKLFESLDEKVFTVELKEALEAHFNEAVETKANQIAEARLEEEIEALNEKSEKHIEEVNAKAEEYVEMKKQEIVEALDRYLDRVVEEFISEAQESLDESLKSEKADLIIEAFDAMLTVTGVEVAKIVEAKDNSSVESKLEESVAKYDTLIEENIALKEENDKLLKAGLISELKEGLSIVESEKFEKLAGLVDFSKDASFVEKLETIKESVKSANKIVEKIVEKVEEQKEPQAPVWAHLV